MLGVFCLVRDRRRFKVVGGRLFPIGHWKIRFENVMNSGLIQYFR